MNKVDPALLMAFQQTTYVVDEPDIRIRIGCQHPQLDDWLACRQAFSWAFLTAWNPRAQLRSPEENAIRMNGLLTDVRTYETCTGRGIPDQPDWQPEDSLLIVNISREDALDLARKWGQLAFVYGEKAGPATLVWC